jgi:hypothetical protein
MKPIFRRTFEVEGDKHTVTTFDDGSIKWKVSTSLGLTIERAPSAALMKQIAWVVAEAAKATEAKPT